ncbi:MAG: high-affinity iron transporter [Porticoccus sp.]|jgi:high-affinity iron transporter
MQAHWIYRFTSPKLFVLNVAVVLLALSCLLPATSQAERSDSFAQMRQLAQLAEYIGVDYVEAVRDGQVVNDGEYQEMLEFSQLIVTNISVIQDSPAKASNLAD